MCNSHSKSFSFNYIWPYVQLSSSDLFISFPHLLDLVLFQLFLKSHNVPIISQEWKRHLHVHRTFQNCIFLCNPTLSSESIVQFAPPSALLWDSQNYGLVLMCEWDKIIVPFMWTQRITVNLPRHGIYWSSSKISFVRIPPTNWSHQLQLLCNFHVLQHRAKFL